MCNIELLCKNRSEVCYTSTLKQLANVKCKIRAKASLWLIPSMNSASGLFINVEKFHIKQKWSENIGFLAKLNINLSARQTTVQYMIWNNANTWKWKCCVVKSMIKSRLDAYLQADIKSVKTIIQEISCAKFARFLQTVRVCQKCAGKAKKSSFRKIPTD